MTIKSSIRNIALATIFAATASVAAAQDTHSDIGLDTSAPDRFPEFVCWRQDLQFGPLALFTASIHPKGLDLNGHVTPDGFIAYEQSHIISQVEFGVPALSKSSLAYALGEADEVTFDQALAALSEFDQKAIREIIKADQNRDKTCAATAPSRMLIS
ncbi:MAG: hypothetical protein GW778_06060 [Alphaproteobacteria bacterium]|nr:hypothetical protein [Alphaproteobacteria bacterium]